MTTYKETNDPEELVAAREAGRVVETRNPEYGEPNWRLSVRNAYSFRRYPVRTPRQYRVEVPETEYPEFSTAGEVAQRPGEWQVRAYWTDKSWRQNANRLSPETIVQARPKPEPRLIPVPEDLLQRLLTASPGGLTAARVWLTSVLEAHDRSERGLNA